MQTASWPITSGKDDRPNPPDWVMAMSLLQRVATSTRTRRWRPVGVGVGICSITIGLPGYGNVIRYLCWDLC